MYNTERIYKQSVFKGFKVKNPLSHLDLDSMTDFEIGYEFEMYSQNELDNYLIKYWGNPKKYKEWLKNVKHGVDLKTNIKHIKTDTELKFSRGIVYPSYIYRDYLPRFSNSVADYKIVVCNDKRIFLSDSRRILDKHNIKLMELEEYLNLLLSLKHSYNTPYSSIQAYLLGYIDNNEKDIEDNSIKKDEPYINGDKIGWY